MVANLSELEDVGHGASPTCPKSVLKRQGNNDIHRSPHSNGTGKLSVLDNRGREREREIERQRRHMSH